MIDLADNLSSIVTAVIALGGLIALLLQRRNSRWRSLTPFWRARQDTGAPGEYPFDAHVPPLLTVYVSRRATRRSSSLTVPTDRFVLDGDDHVLLVGPPGSGKTALVRQAVAASARRWLGSAGRRRHAPAGPVVVDIAAADLVRRTLQEAVAAACKPWNPDDDQAPLPHRRLVVLVDGLDSIIDATRRSDVVNKLAREARPGRRWRLVVTTRQLSDRELRTLQPLTLYDLAPFTTDDVSRLARAWFPDERRAERFTAWLEGQRLGDSARSPLLTTVAATLWEADRPESLPTPDPATLVGHFIDLLLGARRADLAALVADLRRHGPAEITDRLAGHQRDMLEAAAQATLAGTDVVTAWTRAEFPTATLDDHWRKQLKKLLLTTGIFRDDLTPTWPGLVDFLAANPDTQDLTPRSLSTAMRDPSRRAVTTWAVERAGNPEPLLRALLAEPDGSADLERLVATGLCVPDHLLAALLTDPAPAARTLLDTLATDPSHLARLHDLAHNPHQPRPVRSAAHLFFAHRTLTQD